MVSRNKLAELRHNYDAFVRVLPAILQDHADKFALMRHGRVVGYYDSAKEALLAGRSSYEDDLFSVQEVTDSKADFGWYSRAQTDRSL